MRPIGITLLSVVLTALGFVGYDELLAAADLLPLSNTPLDEPSILQLRGDNAIDQSSQALRERDPTFGPYSRYHREKERYQWIFGNATNQYNISISTCITSSDIAGVYQFMNGTTSDNATVGAIYTDLGYGTGLANPEKMIAQTLINAQAAYDDISTFLLDAILCSGDSPLRDELRRHLLFTSDGFQSNGRVMTLVLQGAGTLVAYFLWNGIGLLFADPGVKMVFGGIATLNIVLVLGILTIFQQEAMIAPIEAAFVGTVFVARARSMILQATRLGRAGEVAGPCLTGTQLAVAAAHAGSGSAPSQPLGVVGSADVPGIQQCAAPR